MVPPHIVADQWRILIAYWNSEDAKAIATRNSINREQRGPIHHTGRKHFAQLRYEMEQSGEATDKMSVWIKSRNQEDPDVAEVIEEFQKNLLEKPEDQRQLIAVKDQIFHELIGEDGHGYCRTYGSSVPRSLVYGPEPSVSSIPASTEDLIKKITAEITEKVQDEVKKQFKDELDLLRARVNYLEGGTGTNTLPQVHVDATSGHELRRESVGEGTQNEDSADDANQCDFGQK